MMKINTKDDSVSTRINGTLKEIAEHYFILPDVTSIDILEGAETDTKYYKQVITRLYRADSKEIEKFDLQYNIRLEFKVEYKPEYRNEYRDYQSSCGFMKIE